jgi:wobble nucleotide-excising tRNase
MAQIKRIRTLKGMGVLADRSSKDIGPSFLRYNLIYGFNGSGKSTLSRVFSCLQSGKSQIGLPEGSGFGLELSNGAVLTTPDKLSGLEDHVCIFNSDFVERHLRWAEGKANSIFYISQEQADAAAELKTCETELPKKITTRDEAASKLAEKSRAFSTLKKHQARAIAAKLHMTSRKYEAPNLESDYETMSFDDSSVLQPATLQEYENIAARLAPPPRARSIDVPIGDITKVVSQAKHVAATSIGDAMLAELKANPQMVQWAKTGYSYHTAHGLESCLLCGNSFSAERRNALADAFNVALSEFIDGLTVARGQVNGTINRLELAAHDVRDLAVMPHLNIELKSADAHLSDAMVPTRTLFDEIRRIYTERTAAPTSSVAVNLPSEEAVGALCNRLTDAVATVNTVVHNHNTAVEEFGKHQESARTLVRRHFLAEGHAEYKQGLAAVVEAQAEVDRALDVHKKLVDRIAELRQKIRTHGPAAEVITKLIRAYLGHGELTIRAATEGYELHRHGRPVKGAPSEGEKTAIALCYFLSTLESDGRKIEDLIVFIDDPISSLDTKAMNYACALIRTRVRDAEQVFVVTHNQHCMNEFKKEWRPFFRPKNENTTPTATFLYLDVRMPDGGTTRTSHLVEMSKFLREYDSEYHFLCMKVLEFEQAGTGYSEYGYLMPHIIRRMLELFLAFKVPGSTAIKDKIETLCKAHPRLDKVRMAALERLCQVESHSDSMDDFIAHSSMTIEESRDANSALLMLMEVADADHTKAMRKQCTI